MFGEKKKLKKIVDDMNDRMVPKNLSGMAEIITSMSYDQLKAFAQQFVDLVNTEDRNVRYSKLGELSAKDWVEIMHGWASTDFTPETETPVVWNGNMQPVSKD